VASKSFHVVLNASAGTAGTLGITPAAIRERFEARGHVVDIDADSDTPLHARIERALDSRAEIIVAAGGDGTIAALANALVGTNSTLAILPLGTVNLLARDLHLPLDLDQAVAALGELEPRRIDVGEVNGCIFLHKVVIGLLPSLAAGREHLRGRSSLSAKIGYFRYFARRLARARRFAVAIETEGGNARVERVQAVAVASNAYEEGFGQFFARHRLDRGRLTLYVVRRLALKDMLRLSIEMVLGRWRADEALTIESVGAVTIRSRKGMLKAMVDGEIMNLTAPLEFRIRPLALSVLAPPEVGAAPDEVEDSLVAMGTTS